MKKRAKFIVLILLGVSHIFFFERWMHYKENIDKDLNKKKNFFNPYFCKKLEKSFNQLSTHEKGVQKIDKVSDVLKWGESYKKKGLHFERIEKITPFKYKNMLCRFQKEHKIKAEFWLIVYSKKNHFYSQKIYLDQYGKLLYQSIGHYSFLANYIASNPYDYFVYWWYDNFY